MKQLSLIEMDGFLKGKCIPRDLKVNETNAEYLVRKFGEFESKLETALREVRSAGITIDNLEAKCAALAAEDVAVKQKIDNIAVWPGIEFYSSSWEFNNNDGNTALEFMCDVEIPTTKDFINEIRAQGVDASVSLLIKEDIAGTYDVPVMALEYFAAKIRKGGNQ
ncbi:TPA: hypothetical protein ACIVXL_000572 [Salmonella enterica subsp. houtenae serovar 1,40:z4,z23:-]